MIREAPPDSSSFHPALGPVPELAARVFAILALLLLPIMIVASFDFGVTWDEDSRNTYGHKVLDFLRGIRTREEFRETGGHLYPGLFDTICAALEVWLPFNRWVMRHILTAIVGWIGIVYTGRLAGRLFGSWSGVLALVLLALSPRYFGHSMNNPKDLPFAAMSVVALYYISTVSRRWPYISWAKGSKIAIALALALGVRVGALLYLGYFGLLIGGLVIAERITDWRRLADTALRMAAIVLAVLLLGTLFWPWAGAAPLTRPIIALLGVSSYPWEAFVLYRGFEHLSTQLPWHYAPWWFVITTPPVVLVGAVCSLIFVPNRTDRRYKVILWTIAAFPIVAAILRGSTLYDGVRHLLFVYPVLTVLAAAGWVGVLSWSWTPLQRRLVAAGLAIGLTGALVFMIRYHPNQVTYFNALVGGPNGAFKRYELDYWGNCMLQAVEWGARAARRSGTTVAMAGHPNHLVRQNAERYPEVMYVDDNAGRHHLYVRLARGVRQELRQLAAGPAIHEVKTPDGALLCSVMPGPALSEFGRRPVLSRSPGSASPTQ